MSFKNLSLQAKLLLFVMPIVFTGLMSLSISSYWYIKTIVKEESYNSMLTTVQRSAESINRWLELIMLEPEAIASTPAAKSISNGFAAIDAQNLTRYKLLRKKYEDIFQDIYAANSKGEYHTIIEKDGEYSIFTGNIFNRLYFQSIMLGGPTQISPPLISRTTGIPTMFMVAPIKAEDDRPIGLIGAGINLKYIQKIAKDIKTGKTGFGFIIANNGTYIYHPDEKLIMRSKITEQGTPSIQSLGRRMIAGKGGLYRYKSGDKQMIAVYFPVPVSGWSIASVIPESELLTPVKEMMRLMVMLTLFFLIVVSIAIKLTMERLTRPLKTLARQAEEIASGNLETPAIEVQSGDEIGKLAGAFNNMTRDLGTTMNGLRASEERYRAIFEKSPVGILQASLDGELLGANPTFVTMMRYESYEQMKEETDNIQESFYRYSSQRKDVIEELLQTGLIRNKEIQMKRRDGEFFWISLNITLIRDNAGEPLRIESHIYDIDDKITAEKEREELQLQLTQSQKLEAIGKLAGGVAHDFNNILSVIIGKSELALMKMRATDPFRKSFSDIKKAAEHSANLTRQLLAFARKQTIAPQVADINAIMGDTMTMLRRIISENIDLKQVPASNVWMIKVDPDQVAQVLTNLCVNARDAISGNGQIIIRTENCSLDETYYRDKSSYRPGDYVCLSVSDNGCGMDQETQKHIFEPFFTTKDLHTGTGLGLATVYGIIRQNNGFIVVYSEKNQGTTFKVFLPRYRGRAPRDLPQKQNQETPRGRESILLVEDERDLLQISEQMLTELGYRVFAANGPKEALEYMAEHGNTIDLLLTDVIMPQMNGRDLVARVNSTHPRIRHLYMSGYTADIIAHQGILEEGIVFLQKPFSVHELAIKVRTVLDA